MELLSFGDTGWGDELFFATLMTIAVSIGAMAIGFLFALIFTPLKLSKNKTLNIIGNCYTTIIRGVPELLVIYLLFFGGTGAVMYVASIFGYDGYIEINSSNINLPEARYELVKTMRASVLVMGPLLAKYGKAKISQPGGCNIGTRPIDFHLKGLEMMGAKIESDKKFISIEIFYCF